MNNVVSIDVARSRKPAGPRSTRAAGPALLSLLPSWELALDVQNLSPGTIASYTRSVRQLVAYLKAHDMPTGVDGVQAEHMRAYLSAEKDRTSAGNAALAQRNLNVWWNWLVKQGERNGVSPMAGIEKIKTTRKAKRFLSTDDHRALLKTCAKNTFIDRRDAAIMRIFMDIGVRVSGLANLRYSPVDEGENDVFLARRELRVVLKGGDELIVPLGRRAAAALDAYIRARARHELAELSPWLWLGQRGHNRVHMTASGIQQMLRRRGEQAGVPGVHPHRFRATFAHDYLDGGGDLDGLCAITGWSTFEMARLYAGELAAARARRAHDRLSPGDRI